ncbi:MAG: ribulose-phosphate 3-epimerase [Oscillospiraceae bacterium]|nr:ribulose-phosphate 3-epimerase [Oscillospiraceae bacterium]
MIYVSTSILTVEKEKSTKIFYDLEVAGTDYFHIDVMDGEFVRNDTSELMMEYATLLTHISNLPLDVHLMVKDVEYYINEYIPLNPNIITIHYESFEDKKRLVDTINLIKENNIKVGISIKPTTHLEEILEFLPLVHLVLIMTVEPGEGGQRLIMETLQKIKNLKQYIDENDLEIDIEADGGINEENANFVKLAGANILVAGTAIINSNNFAKVIQKLGDKV